MKKAIKVLTTSESLISLVMTFGQIPVMIVSGKTIIVLIAILLMFLGLILIYKIVRKELKKIDFDVNNKLSSIEVKSAISIYIQNPQNKSEFKGSKLYNQFKPMSLELEFYLIKLSDKFPNLTCSELKSLIQSSLNEHH